MQLHADRSDRFAQELFSPLPARYDLLAELLSFGQNRRWRRQMVDHSLVDRPGRVLDVACGTAGVTRQLATRSRASVVGVDLTEAMLRQGQRTVDERGLGQRIDLVVGNAVQLPFAARSFDALTFTYLLRYVRDPEETLCELARVVRPGAMVASLEFCVPQDRFFHAWWWLYTRAVLPVLGWATGGEAWYEVGRFLGPNITEHYRRYPVEWTVEAWRRAGFDQVGYRLMSLGGGLVMWGRRASD